MGAFNRARFDLAQFNTYPASELWIGINYTERIDSLIATSEKSSLEATAFENVRIENSSVNPGRMLRAAGAETTGGLLWGCAFFKASGGEAVTIENLISQLAWIRNSPAEIISYSGYISANNWFYPHAVENVNTESYIGQLFYETGESTEVVDMSVSAVALDEIICELAVTLRPGQVLVIDANNYNVLLDGQNAIHIQSGAWLDEMNRETQNVRITADYPANLSATILYTERFL